MANAKAKLFYTKEKYLSTLPIVNGQIIFVPDSHKVCLDMSKERFTYQTILELETERDRLSIHSPSSGFYYVEEDDAIWRYNNGWVRVTPRNLEPTLYGETEQDFPTEGNPNSLYFTDDGIFNWKAALSEYNLIANANKWDEI